MCLISVLIDFKFAFHAILLWFPLKTEAAHWSEVRLVFGVIQRKDQTNGTH